MTLTQHQTLQDAIDMHGPWKQIDMLHEEIGELMQAINKLKRCTETNFPIILHPNHGGDVKYSQAYFNVCSEIADVKIMLEQMELLFDAEAVQLAFDRKITRLRERLDKLKNP